MSGNDLLKLQQVSINAKTIVIVENVINAFDIT